MSNKLIIRNEMDLMTLGKVLAESKFFSDSTQAAQAVVKVMTGQELGFGPVASMTGIHIIKGKVSLGANLLAAAIKRSGRYNYKVLSLTKTGCKIEFYENGEAVGVSEFTVDDAKDAGVLNKDNWKKHTKNMYFSRALTNGQKWFCPDVGSGSPIYTPEELGAEVDGETGEILTIEVEPAPAKSAPPDSPESLLELLKTKTDHYTKVPHLLNAIKKMSGPDWTWPKSDDIDGWRNAYKIALDYAKRPNDDSDFIANDKDAFYIRVMTQVPFYNDNVVIDKSLKELGIIYDPENEDFIFDELARYASDKADLKADSK